MTSRDDSQHRVAFTIRPDHPAIPGHFPGNPVVPGVLILDEVRRATLLWFGHEANTLRLPHAKFMSPLRPGEEATIELARSGATIGFSVSRGGALVAKGTFEFGPVQTS